jgi:hypothetical protein
VYDCKVVGYPRHLYYLEIATFEASHLIVATKGIHRLEVEGTTRLQELSSGGMQFGLSLPAAVAGSLSLSAPGDLEIHATVPVATSSYDRQSDRTRAELASILPPESSTLNPIDALPSRTAEQISEIIRILGRHEQGRIDVIAVVTGDSGLSDNAPIYRAISDAMQSGPILVTNGRIHPRFIPGYHSRHIRNGVGVDGDGRVVFAISNQPVNFHDFATLFRDALDCPDALYLDGSISEMYAPELFRFGGWPCASSRP